jgi:hypothetical protein
MTMPATLGLVVAMALLVQGAAASDTLSRQEGEPKKFQTEPTRTGKERIGSKSSDEQRVDNCKVPLELRGSKPRPDDCVDAGRAPASSAPTVPASGALRR